MSILTKSSIASGLGILGTVALSLTGAPSWVQLLGALFTAGANTLAHISTPTST